MTRELLRQLPKMDVLLEREAIVSEINKGSRTLMVTALRNTLENCRQRIISGAAASVSLETVEREALSLYKSLEAMNLKQVINATGTILHTNLGRSTLSQSAADAVYSISRHYSNLEYNLAEGTRGERYDAISSIVTEITGAEAALAVNNNAAAVLLTLSAVAKGKKVIVSRGEQVEIGGKFRVPEIMEQSGAILTEIGATNKVRLSDYEEKIEDNSVLLKVHTSNFKIIGFTEEVTVAELSVLAQKHGVPFIYDLGSGALIDFEKYGIYGEPTVQKAVSDGADIICFSGDKLLGGPQAGIIIGRKKYIDILKKHPLTRAFRIDKMTLAALEATLREYREEKKAIEEIPVLNKLLAGRDVLRARGEKLLSLIKSKSPEADAFLIEEKGQVGGGSMPGLEIDTWAVRVLPSISAGEAERRLRTLCRPIICRVTKGTLIFDLLTIDEVDLEYIAESIKTIIAGDI